MFKKVVTDTAAEHDGKESVGLTNTSITFVIKIPEYINSKNDMNYARGLFESQC